MEKREILPYELHYFSHISRLPVIVAESALPRVVGGLNMYRCSMAAQARGITGSGVAVRKWCCCNGCFVVQVVGGQEDRAATLIAKIAQGAVEDCFVPMREVTHRKSGQWRRTLEKLFPGYVFVQTGTPEQVREARITRIDRHKRLAWVDMNMFGRHKAIRVGLEIVSKK